MNTDFRMVRTTVHLPEDLLMRLRKVAEQRRVSTAAVMRAAMEAATSSYRPEPVGGILQEREIGRDA